MKSSRRRGEGAKADDLPRMIRVYTGCVRLYVRRPDLYRRVIRALEIIIPAARGRGGRR